MVIYASAIILHSRPNCGRRHICTHTYCDFINCWFLIDVAPFFLYIDLFSRSAIILSIVSTNVLFNSYQVSLFNVTLILCWNSIIEYLHILQLVLSKSGCYTDFNAIYSNNAKIVYEYNILMTFFENCYPSYEHVICQDSEKLTILSTNKGNNKRLWPRND